MHPSPKRKIFRHLVIPFLVMCGCSVFKGRKPSLGEDLNYPQEYDVVNGVFDRTFYKAVKIVNVLSNQRPQFKLEPDAAFYDFSDSVKIPIYLVSKKLTSFCLVPAKKRTIIVQDDYKYVLNSMLSSKSDSLQLVNDFMPELLAVFLLHELGHIKAKDYNKDITINISSSYNIENTEAKEIEQKADDFAASVIRNSIADNNNLIRSIFAQNCLTAINFAVNNLNVNFRRDVKLSWKDSNVLWWDENYTHKNTQLRLWTISHLIGMSQNSGKELQEYFLKRQNN